MYVCFPYVFMRKKGLVEMELKVVYKNLNELREYENNPRENNEAIEPVAESIKKYGFLVPVLLDNDNTIIAGHTRKKAAEMLDFEKVPCIYAEGLTEEQIREFRLVDNKTSEFATWNFEKLVNELSEIANEELATVFDFPDINMDISIRDEDFLQDTEIVKNKEKKRVKCPHCGEELEV